MVFTNIESWENSKTLKPSNPCAISNLGNSGEKANPTEKGDE